MLPQEYTQLTEFTFFVNSRRNDLLSFYCDKMTCSGAHGITAIVKGSGMGYPIF